MFSRIRHMTAPVAAVTLATSSLLYQFHPSSLIACCEKAQDDSNDQEQSAAATATATTASVTTTRHTTKQELHRLRRQKTALYRQWEADEDGWHELPARAWPAHQPNESQLVQIRERIAEFQCTTATTVAAAATGTGTAVAKSEQESNGSDKENADSEQCQKLLFDMSTALVFCTVDPEVGLEQYQALARRGHVDSMIAVGVILVDGIVGNSSADTDETDDALVGSREKEGFAWLQKAAATGSAQACFELGCVYYTGIQGTVEEDAARAFTLFEAAAEHNHTAAMYMMADCLLEGEGTAVNVARAVPLLHRAANRGHRHARQRIRQLLQAEAYMTP